MAQMGEPNQGRGIHTTRLVWFFALFVAVVTISGIVFTAAGGNILQSWLLTALYLVLPIAFLVLHATTALPPRRGWFFMVAATILGLFCEWTGVKYGTIFGGHYIYDNIPLKVFGVPVIIALYWAAFVYTAYSLTNTFWLLLGRQKPRRKVDSFMWVIFFSLSDALLNVALDIFLDPIAVKSGMWHWQEQGVYFGVPIGNFFGWMFLTVVISMLFRTLEYLLPKRHAVNISIQIIPLFAYGLLVLLFLAQAVQFQMTTVAIVGMSITSPIIAVHLGNWAWWCWKIFVEEHQKTQRTKHSIKKAFVTAFTHSLEN